MFNQSRNVPDPRKTGRRDVPDLYRTDGTVLPPHEAEEVAHRTLGLPGGWRTAAAPSKAFNPRERLSWMKHLVKGRSGGILDYFTAPPEGHHQARDKEIDDAAMAMGLRYYNRGIVKCFNDIIAGGRFLPPSLWLEEARKRRIDVSRTSDQLSGLTRVMKSIDFTKIPGATSLHKAVATVKLLGLIDQRAACDSGDDRYEIFYGDRAAEEKCVSTLNAALEKAQSLDKAEALLLGGKLAGDEHRELELTVELIESLLRDRSAELIMKVARILDKLPKLRIQGETTIERDKNGIEVRARLMESMNELPKIAKSNWALFQEHPELFWSKALNLEFNVREHISRKSQKQLLYMLIDSSGSMDDGNRIKLALATLLNRLKGVIKGEASLHYRFFDTDVFDEHSVETADQAHRAIETLRRNNFSGGGTNISRAIRTAVNSICAKQENGQGIRPHLALVSDGESYLDVTLDELKGTVLHVFLIANRNPDLEKLAKASGGMAVYLSDDGDAKVL